MLDIGLPRRALAGQALLFGLWLSVTIAGFALRPDPQGHGTHTQFGLPPCPSALFWDRPCPGCGLTTSIAALLHGDLGLAFRAHAFGPPLYLFFTAVAWLAMARFVAGRRLDTSSRAWTIGLAAFTVSFLLYGGLRMALDTGYRSASEARIMDADSILQRP